MINVFKDLFVYPEKTFTMFNSRLSAYTILYVLPLIICLSIMASSLFYGYIPMLIITPVVFGIIYPIMVGYAYKGIKQSEELLRASEEQVPEKLISYFHKQYPSSTIPLMVSDNKLQWVAYGHIDRNRMARTMTFVEYHLMAPPPKLTNYFMENVDKIKHAYLIIEDPKREIFRITETPLKGTVCYPVTVFDKEEVK